MHLNLTRNTVCGLLMVTFVCVDHAACFFNRKTVATKQRKSNFLSHLPSAEKIRVDVKTLESRKDFSSGGNGGQGKVYSMKNSENVGLLNKTLDHETKSLNLYKASKCDLVASKLKLNDLEKLKLKFDFYNSNVERQYSKRTLEKDGRLSRNEPGGSQGPRDTIQEPVVMERVDIHTGKGFDLLFTSNNATYHNWPVPVAGRIPYWLNGTLIKNGPALFEMGSTSFTHLLDGYAKLAKFTFTRENSILFSTNFLNTRSYSAAALASKIRPYLLFGSRRPQFSWFEKFWALYNEADNTNINVYDFPAQSNDNSPTPAMEYVALSDFWHVYQFDPQNLQEAIKIRPRVPGPSLVDNFLPLISSSHPIREFGKSSLVTILSVVNPIPEEPSTIHVVRIHSTESREQIAEIKVERLSYMHAFALTRHYAIIFADPLFIDFEKTFSTVTLSGSFVWMHRQRTTVYVVHTETKEIWNVTIRPSVHLHHINSYESHGKIVIDYVVYPTINMVHYKLDILMNMTARNAIKQNSRIIRYIIDTETRTIQRIKHKNSAFKFIMKLDFPAINEAYRFSRHCYIYGVVSKTDGHDLSMTALVKKDICNSRDLVWSQPNLYPSEAVFVAKPDSSSEDDGVLLTLVLDGNRGISFILILNAASFEETGRAYLPTYMTFTVHGRYFPNL